jgi:hypothetical protein
VHAAVQGTWYATCLERATTWHGGARQIACLSLGLCARDRRTDPGATLSLSAAAQSGWRMARCMREAARTLAHGVLKLVAAMDALTKRFCSLRASVSQ